MKIAVIGSNGQLGSDILKTLNANERIQEFPITHQDVELSDYDSVANYLNKINPEVVINCAAFHQIDKCEQNPSLAFDTNTLGALYVARICSELNALCVYISTDYVYEGIKKTPYLETDIPSPINIYGTTKLAGENLTTQACENSLIIRLSSLFGKAGSKGKGGNFIETILNKARSEKILQVVNDIHISPTYTKDASMIILELINRNTRGLVNVANSTSPDCTWYLLAKKTFELCNLNVQVDAISSNAYPSIAKRPTYSVLNNEKAENIIGNKIPDWEDAVKRYLTETQRLF